MFWTRAILWKIIKVLGYLIGMVRYYPARKKYFFCPILDTSTYPEAYRMHPYGRDRSGYQGDPVCDGTLQYQCDYGCLQSRYGSGKDRLGDCQTG